MKITFHSVSQRAGLSDIKNLALAIPEKIDSRPGREAFQLGLDFFGQGFHINIIIVKVQSGVNQSVSLNLDTSDSWIQVEVTQAGELGFVHKPFEV